MKRLLMNPKRGRASLWCALVTLALLVPSVQAGGTLDEGLLDPEWFGGQEAFGITDEIDYLWVADGFSIEGQVLRLGDWEDPEFLRGKKRDSKDSARAFELTDRMPSMLRGALSTALDGRAEVSKSEGELTLIGRFVDVNAGSKAAKWLVGMGAGSASATWDMKIVDASGEVKMALHHRAVSGTTMSDIDDKVVKWLDEGLGDAFARGLSAVYAGAKPAKK